MMTTNPPLPRPPKPEPGLGDDVPCEKCGAVALDTGLECDECGHDNYEAVTGKPFESRGPSMTDTTDFPPLPEAAERSEQGHDLPACNFTAEQMHAYLLADRASRAPAQDGWQLVPAEPTEAMKKAGGHANSEWLNDNAPIGEVRYAMPMNSVWQAMLASAPSALEALDAMPQWPVAEDLRTVLRWEEKRIGAVSAGVLRSVIGRLEKSASPSDQASPDRRRPK